MTNLMLSVCIKNVDKSIIQPYYTGMPSITLEIYIAKYRIMRIILIHGGNI